MLPFFVNQLLLLCLIIRQRGYIAALIEFKFIGETVVIADEIVTLED